MQTTRSAALAWACTGLFIWGGAQAQAHAQAQPQVQAQASPAQQLAGRWRVDLRPTPGAAPYLQVFEVKSVSGQGFKGRFYGTAFDAGLVNADWGDVRIAFTTADGKTAYHHTATLRNGRLEGLTHAPGRGFLAVWTATREAAR